MSLGENRCWSLLDTEGSKESVRIKRVMLLRSEKHFLLEQKKWWSIVKFNIYNLHKAIIWRTKSTETLKIAHLYITFKNYFIRTVLCITSLSAKVWTHTTHPIECTVMLGTSTCCQMKVFSPSKRKGLWLLWHTVDNEVSARLTSYENLLIGPETSVHCLH